MTSLTDQMRADEDRLARDEPFIEPSSLAWMQPGALCWYWPGGIGTGPRFGAAIETAPHHIGGPGSTMIVGLHNIEESYSQWRGDERVDRTRIPAAACFNVEQRFLWSDPRHPLHRKPLDRADDPAWIQCHSGRRFYLADPHETDVAIEDIAHALSLINRYTGHSRKAISVAQHSVNVCEIAGELMRAAVLHGFTGEYLQRCVEVEYVALLHDAPEYVYGDVATPLKRLLPDYQRIYDHGATVILGALGVTLPFHPIVHRADKIALTEEREALHHVRDAWPGTHEPGRGRPFVVMSADEAERAFMARYEELRAVVGR